VSLFVAATRRRLNERKISFEDFIAECKLRNKNRVSVFEFAIIVERVNCGRGHFKARELFAQISRTRDSPHTRDSSQSTQSRDSVSMESFRALFLKAAKLPLEELPSDVPPKRVHAHSLTLPNHPADSFCSQAQESSHYYAAVGFNKLLHFVSVAGTKPEKLFDDCDCDRSGFVDKNEFNKLLFATDLL
jgi:hypothetical protein